MSAEYIIANAPLGAIISFADGTPRPISRYRRKLAEWITRNDRGRLIRKEPAFVRGNYRYPGGFGLQIDKPAVTLTRHFQVGSQLNFEICELPPPGSVYILVSSGDTDELVHLAHDMAEAQAWMVQHRISKARLETVKEEA
jgi:hypothetical protein